MYAKLIIYLLHLIIVFPYLFILGQKLKNTKYDKDSKILIPVSLIGFGYQLYLLINIIIIYFNI